MSDTKSLIRQWRLLRFLADARVGYTVKELREEMSVSVVTIRRDLIDLGTAGFRVHETVGYRGLKRWRVEGFEDNFGFTITDLISIYMGRQFLEPLAGTPFWEGQQKVFSKIRANCKRFAFNSHETWLDTSKNPTGTKARNSRPKKTAACSPNSNSRILRKSNAGS